MIRVLKLVVSGLLAFALLLGIALAALAWWLSGDGPRLRLQEMASAQLGVPVVVEKISLDVWPLPAVALEGLVIQTQPRLRAQRLQARPAWGSLMHEPRQLELLSLHMQGVQLPQQGLDQVRQSLLKQERSAQIPYRLAAQNVLKTADKTASIAPLGLLAIAQRITLDQLTWQSAAGQDLTISGSIDLSVARDAAELDLQLAGGTLRGPIVLSGIGKVGPVQLHGELNASQLDLSILPGLRERLSGRLQATITLDAQAAQLDALGQALQTRTQFSASTAVIKGIDLVRAVTTLGLSRGGETALSQLSGNLSTRGMGASMQLALSDLQATSSILKASGAVDIGAAASAGGPRPLSGKVNVDLTAGNSRLGQEVNKVMGQLVGIALEISGTSSVPQVQPTRGAMIGGAIGSVLAPVIGTGAGAKMGDRVAEKLSEMREKLFGK